MYRMNGIEWNISLIRSDSTILMKPDGRRAVGACVKIDRCIYLSEDLRGAFLRRVLLHEITHSAMMSYNIDLSVEQEEIVCEILSLYGDEIFNIADNLFMELKRRTA